MIMTSTAIPPVYSMTLCKEACLDGIPRASYGISCRNGDASAAVEDISCNRALVGKMAELFNACELPPYRLWEAITALIP